MDLEKYFNELTKQAEKLRDDIKNSKVYTDTKKAIDDWKEERDYRCAKALFDSIMMPTDIIDTEDEKEYIINLAGCKKEDISVKIEGDYLIVSAMADSEDDVSYDLREREHVNYTRQYLLADDLKGSNCIKASYQNGVLRVIIQKNKVPVTEIMVE